MNRQLNMKPRKYVGGRRWAVISTLMVAACCCGIADAADAADKGKSMSPPTKADAWDLKKDFAKIEQQWTSIIAVLESEEYYAIRSEDVSAWSCGQQAVHLALTLNGTAESIEKLLANPAQNVNGEVSDMGKGLLTSGMIPRGVGQAPAELRPESTSQKELLKTLKEAKKKWKTLAAKTDELESCQGRLEHPAGMLLGTDWVRLMAVHNAHHLKIVRDILKSSSEAGSNFGNELGK